MGTRPPGEGPDPTQRAPDPDVVETQAWGTFGPDDDEASEEERPREFLLPDEEVDHFRVLRLLGRGGMGEVYLARDTQLGRKVALKVLHPTAIGSGEALDRFLFEARATARFNHPHIVTIHAVGDYDGFPYVALEYIEGETLRERLDAERAGVHDAVRICLAVGEALEEAHRHEILHRDLKPGNIMIGHDGRVRVLDFGLAKHVPTVRGDGETAEWVGEVAPEPGVAADLEEGSEDGYLARPDLTLEHGVRGTPGYMSPEQWAGATVTAATDVWSLGLLLFEMLDGHHPLPGASAHELMLRVCRPDAMPALEDDLPPVLAELVARCLEKAPGRRPDVAEVVGALQEFLGQRREGAQPGRSPFRGLLPFHERDAGRFFGRDTEIGTYLERLRDEPVLPVVGPSGVGKSSFVRAGVLPRLREQGPWVVLGLRPGRQPIRALAQRLVAEDSTRASTLDRSLDSGGRFAGTATTSSSLVIEPRSLDEAESELWDQLQRSPSSLSLVLGRIAEQRGARVLLFVDQLEEIFTLVERTAVRRAFISALCFAADDPQGPVRVVFTLRDDFLGRLAGVPEAREALSRVTVLGSPSPEALLEIVSRPVAQAGYRYDDPALAQEMVDSVRDETAALPLLQFAGRMLWRRRDRDRRLLRRSVYDEMGGVEGALAHHADGVMERFTPAQARVSRELFLRLVTPEQTRRVLPEDQLLDGLGEEAPEVLDRLVAERAILAHKAKGGGVAELELVHESLIRNWGRLQRWIEDSGEERAFLEEVGQAAELWARRGRRADEVWREDALWDALRRAERLANAPDVVRQFLAAGRDRERRRGRRRRNVVRGIIAVVALIAVVLGVQTWLALDQRRRAEVQRATAQLEGARAAAARGDVLEARAKLRGSLETTDSPLARALWMRLRADPLAWHHTLGAGVWDVALSPDGRTVAVACLDRTVPLLDAATREGRVLRGHEGQVHFVRYSPDGGRLLSAADGGEVLVWDLEQGSFVRLEGHRDRVAGAAFSPDGQRVVTGSFDGTARIWDTETGAMQHLLEGHESFVRDPAWSADGRWIATPSDDGTVRLWEAANGTLARVLEGHDERVDVARFSPDSGSLATAGWDGTARLWDVATGAQRHVLEGHGDRVYWVDFVPGGEQLVSAGWDQTLRSWDVATGAPRHVLEGHDGFANEIEIGPSGRLVAAGSADRTVRVWDLDSGEPVRVYRGHEGGVQGVGFGPEGRWLVSGGEDRQVRLWDLEIPALEDVARGHEGGTYGVAVHPAGGLAASAGGDHTVRLWELESGETRAILRGHVDGVRSVDFHPAGEILASAALDRTVRLWDVAGGSLLSTIPAPPNLIAVRYSPDGSRLAGHSLDGLTWIWDPATGDRVAELAGGGWDLAFHPAGGRFALASWSNTIPIHDLATGRLLRELRGHDNEVIGVRYSPDGRFLVSGGIDGTVRLWDLVAGTARVLDRLDGRVHWVDVHPGGGIVGAPVSDGNAYLWDLSSGERTDLAGHRGEVNGLRFDGGGRWVVTTSDDGSVRTWDAATGRPHWRSVVVATEPLRAYTHRGWQALGSGEGVAPLGEEWERAVEQAGLQGDIDGKRMCLRTAEGLEIWDVGEDRRLAQVRIAGLVEVRAAGERCAALQEDGTLALASAGEEPQTVATDVRAWSVEDGALLVVVGDGVQVLDGSGTVVAEHEAPAGVSAVGRVGDQFVFGFDNGGVEIRRPGAGESTSTCRVENASSMPVTRLGPGPLGTVIAGWASGHLGVFHADSGACLHRARLHGAVRDLQTAGDELAVVTDLGDTAVIDLSPFHADYCALVQEVWAGVPVVWEEGRTVAQPTHATHRCGH